MPRNFNKAEHKLDAVVDRACRVVRICTSEKKRQEPSRPVTSKRQQPDVSYQYPRCPLTEEIGTT